MGDGPLYIYPKFGHVNQIRVFTWTSYGKVHAQKSSHVCQRTWLQTSSRYGMVDTKKERAYYGKAYAQRNHQSVPMYMLQNPTYVE